MNKNKDVVAPHIHISMRLTYLAVLVVVQLRNDLVQLTVRQRTFQLVEQRAQFFPANRTIVIFIDIFPGGIHISGDLTDDANASGFHEVQSAGCPQ